MAYLFIFQNTYKIIQLHDELYTIMNKTDRQKKRNKCRKPDGRFVF